MSLCVCVCVCVCMHEYSSCVSVYEWSYRMKVVCCFCWCVFMSCLVACVSVVKQLPCTCLAVVFPKMAGLESKGSVDNCSLTVYPRHKLNVRIKVTLCKMEDRHFNRDTISELNRKSAFYYERQKCQVYPFCEKEVSNLY